MTTNFLFRSLLLSAGALLMTACATPSPDSTRVSMADIKFQRVAKTYVKYQYEGQTVYCKKDEYAFDRLNRWRPKCLTEPQLRDAIDTFARTRNPVQPAVIGTPSSIG